MDIQDIKERVSPVFAAQGVHRAILFGSFARGTQSRHSDIDLMIIVPTSKKWLHRDQDFLAIYSLFPKQGVDLLIYTPQELEAIAHRPFIQQILSQGCIIYESGKGCSRSEKMGAHRPG